MENENLELIPQEEIPIQTSPPDVSSGDAVTEYPIYKLDADGNIVQATSIPAENGSAPVVVYSNDNSGLEAPLNAMQEDVAFLAAQQASNAGYLSTSALDTFDRVVEGYDYDYYCAYRYDSDTYNSMMYMSDKMTLSGTVVHMKDAVQVKLYRTYHSGSNYYYTYHYQISNAGDVDINLGSNLMYYTNCKTGYPILGHVPAPNHYPAWVTLFVLLLAFLLFFVFRRRKQ